MDNVKRLVKPRGHFINDRKVEMMLGIFLFLLGSLLIYDAFDGRGKGVPWPGGAILPW